MLSYFMSFSISNFMKQLSHCMDYQKYFFKNLKKFIILVERSQLILPFFGEKEVNLGPKKHDIHKDVQP